MGPRRSLHSLLLAAMAVLAGASCTPERATPVLAPAAPTSAAPGAGKPTAPVEVELDARPLAGGEHELTLTATPAVDVDALELRLGDRRESVGHTRAGETRTMRLRVGTGTGAAASIEVTGGAAVSVGGVRQSRGAAVRLGASAPYAAPALTRVVTLPGGERVAEGGR